VSNMTIDNELNKDYKKYLSHFQRLNRLTREEYEQYAKSYGRDYDEFLPKDKSIRILDIGCGGGHFLYFLLKKGYYNVEGIDISPSQVLRCKQIVNAKVVVADVFKFLPLRKKTYDVIVMNDFIEHFTKKQIRTLLQLVYESLKDGGKVIIRTPNMASITGLRSRYMDLTHKTGFTEESLFQILEMSGFRDIIIKGISITGLKSKVSMFLMWLFVRLAYGAAGIHPPPRILTANLLACASK